MSDTAPELLRNWVSRQASAEAGDWFEKQCDKLQSDFDQKSFDIAFGLVPRKLGKEDLALSAEDLAAADAARPGWNPGQWSLDVAARVCFLVTLSKELSKPFAERFKSLHRTADLGELLALFSGLPLYAAPESLVLLAADGLRTNIKAEFEAVAHRNPFPAEQFDQNPWNNMVLKALFVGVLLEPIQGLDERANPELARILRDYAHERWAADRLVSPELWRCIGPFAQDEDLADFQRVIEHGHATEKKAVALALTTAPESAGKADLCARLSEYNAAISDGTLTWRAIADEMFDNALAITRKLNFEVEMKR
ncbi:MAG: EboA domain-containing protein [Rhodospirillales bacterium]|nr:EboA domain-containing protein [Rhodospirillales bacterium]